MAMISRALSKSSSSFFSFLRRMHQSHMALCRTAASARATRTQTHNILQHPLAAVKQLHGRHPDASSRPPEKSGHFLGFSKVAPEICSNEQGRFDERPQCEMRSLLSVGQPFPPRIPHLQRRQHLHPSLLHSPSQFGMPHPWPPQTAIVQVCFCTPLRGLSAPVRPAAVGAPMAGATCSYKKDEGSAGPEHINGRRWQPRWVSSHPQQGS